MDEATSFDTTKRQTINPLVDEINKGTEPLLKAAVTEIIKAIVRSQVVQEVQEVPPEE